MARRGRPEESGRGEQDAEARGPTNLARGGPRVSGRAWPERCVLAQGRRRRLLHCSICSSCAWATSEIATTVGARRVRLAWLRN